MLRSMRDKFKSGGPMRLFGLTLLWGVIASFVLLIFVGWGLGGVGGGSGGRYADEVAIDVAGRSVTRAAFLRQLRDYQDNLRRQLGPDAESLLAQINLRDQVRNALVNKQVAVHEATRLGLRVTDEEVRDHILRTFVDETGAFVGRERVERYIRNRNFTPKQYQAALAEDLLLRKLQSLVEAGAVVTEAEVRAEYVRRNDRAKVDYVFLDAGTAASEVSPGDPELRAFHRSHPDRFQATERKARYVLWPVADFAARVTPSEEELKGTYQELERTGRFREQRRASHILLKVDPDAPPEVAAQAADRAQALLERARAAESFEELARLSSEDAASAIQGGDLGWFGRDRMVAPFAEAVFDPTLKPDALVGPVKTSFGYHVIKLTGIQPARSFTQARPEVEGLVRERRGRELALEAARAFIASHGEAAPLPATVDGRDVQETPFLREDSTSASLPRVAPEQLPAFLRALYAIPAALKLGAQPVSLGDAIAVLQVAELRGPSPVPFEECRDKVLVEYRLDRGRELVAAKLASFRSAQQQGKTLAEAATAAAVELKSLDSLSRTGVLPGVPQGEEAVRQAFSLPVGQLSEPIPVAAGTALVYVRERFRFDEAKFAADKESLLESLESRKRSDVWDSLLGQLRRDLEQRNKIRYLATDLFQPPQDEEEMM